MESRCSLKKDTMKLMGKNKSNLCASHSILCVYVCMHGPVAMHYSSQRNKLETHEKSESKRIISQINPSKNYYHVI